MKKITTTEKFSAKGKLIERTVITEETAEASTSQPVWLNPTPYTNPFVPYCLEPSSIVTNVPPGTLVTYTSGVAGSTSGPSYAYNIQ